MTKWWDRERETEVRSGHLSDSLEIDDGEIVDLPANEILIVFDTPGTVLDFETWWEDIGQDLFEEWAEPDTYEDDEDDEEEDEEEDEECDDDDDVEYCERCLQKL